VVAQIAALEAGELLALARHLRPRLVPGEEPPAAAVAERIVRMSAAELQELVQRLRERLAPASAEG
jgi:antitoxin (DNA-binding transcriptional repressor) of toxin-antitoxin stability system